MEMMWKETTAE